MKGESRLRIFLPRAIKLSICHLMEFQAKMERRLNVNAMIIVHYDFGGFADHKKINKSLWRYEHSHCKIDLHRNEMFLNCWQYPHSRMNVYSRCNGFNTPQCVLFIQGN